jgi:nucleotide-binding universal stress UspA family protein
VTAPALGGILVPLDGSEVAEQALAVGASRARASGVTLHLVSVHQPMPALAMPPDVPVDLPALEEQARANLAAYLESAAAVARTSLPTPVVSSVITGAVAASLSEYAESHSIGLVVMTTHGRGGLNRWLLGSVADQLLRHLEVPILLLHPRDVPQPTEFHRLLVALGDAETEEPVVKAALALGGAAPAARYVFTRVVEPTIPVLSGLAARPGHLPPNWDQTREVEARNYLTQLTDRLRATGLDATWQVLVGRGVAAQVFELADTLGADCIVAGTYGPGGMERLLLGSMADKIVRGAKVPVLVAPVRRSTSAATRPSPAR